MNEEKKQTYEPPNIEIIWFQVSECITASGDYSDVGEWDTEM